MIYFFAMSRKHSFAVGEYYHVYNRGTEKRTIFLDDGDHKRFMSLLHLANNTEIVHISNLLNQGRTLMELLEVEVRDRLVSIGAYCLMPNHFHLLVREKVENGASKFMQKLITGYSMYFNKKYERSGNLFQGRFKSNHIDEDVYLKHLYSYIHLNPLKLIARDWRERPIEETHAKKFLGSYYYSSYHEHYKNTDRSEKVILEQSVFPDYFQNKQEGIEELFSWLQPADNIKVEP